MPEKDTPVWGPPVYAIMGSNPPGIRPFPIVLVKCWKVAHWNTKTLPPKFQKLPPKFHEFL